MGRRMVRLTLKEYLDLWDKVGRIVFVGTPHYGSQALGGLSQESLWGFRINGVAWDVYESRGVSLHVGSVASPVAPGGVYPGTRTNDLDPWSEPKSAYPHPCSILVCTRETVGDSTYPSRRPRICRPSSMQLRPRIGGWDNGIKASRRIGAIGCL